MDKIIALTLILAFSPILLLICTLLSFQANGIFFSQWRIGHLEKPFLIYKFKTMYDGTDVDEESRITPIGKVLRKLSLDELPQLWNILLGEMSFIGPRPLLVEYLPLYSENHKRRHWVMPGITGLAQVKGRNNLPWEERLDLDVYYESNMNFFLDIKVLFLTAAYFINGSEGTHPPKKFAGYNQ